MQCPFCSSEIQDLAKGICDKCWESKNQRLDIKTGVSTKFLKSDNIKHAGLTKFIAIVGFYLFIIFIASSREQSATFSYEINGTEVFAKEKNGETTVVFKRGEETDLKIALMQLEASPSVISDMGMQLSLIYLLPTDYATYKKDYKNAGRCPAKFMNSHANVLQLVVNDNSLLQDIKDTKWTEGDNMKLQGEYLSVKDINKNNSILPMKLSGNFQIFRLYNFEIETQGDY